MTDLSGDYSGIVINQNSSPVNNFDWRGTYGGNWIYQTFTLPGDYQRGSLDTELSIPDLTGFQLFVNIDQGYAQSASLDYTLDYYDGDWITIASGTQVGSHSDGDCWIDVIFSQSIPITDLMLGAVFRLGVSTRTVHNSGQVETYPFDQPVMISNEGIYLIGGIGYQINLIPGVPYPITVGTLPAYLLQTSNGVVYSIQMGIDTVGYVEPTPLVDSATSHGQAYQANGLTPLLGTGTTASLNFRILGLIADSGTDFLGNEYRSAVISAAGTNMDTTSTTLGSTQNGYYKSGPMPSKFAIVPTYWDVRPQATVPTYGVVNLISNPSFEYDALNSTPALWVTTDSSNISHTLFAVKNAWANSGVQSLRSTSTFSTALSGGYSGVTTPLGLSGIPIKGTQVYCASAVVDIYTLPSSSGLGIYFRWYDSTGTFVSTTSPATLASATGVTTLTNVAAQAPQNAAYVAVSVMANNNSTGTLDFSVDAISMTTGPVVQPYFDGDNIGYEWTGQRGHSPSIQIITADVQDDTIVVDSILVDPITPNMSFNVYYSTDDTGTGDDMTETDWENKLWIRVPQVFVCTQRQQYALPEPIIAKYICVEFTNLQAQTYDPGAFATPVSYKKMPTWVANFFIAQIGQTAFIVDQVNVQYDALNFAYDYYLDDLDQSPATPSAAPINASAQLTGYFNSTTSTQGIDATTLSQINLVMNTFAQTPDVNVDTDSVLGSYVQSVYNSTASPAATVESSTFPQLSYSTVSSLARDQLVYENNLPVMYFFLTCRHSYKILQASFDYNRAYFAGVNQISFIRNDYTTQADTDLYIESGGDDQNSELNDWVVNAGTWYTYAN